MNLIKKSSYFLLFILIICFLNCKENKDNIETNSDIVLEKLVTKVPKKIIITGTSDDTIALKYINIINNDYLFGTNHKYIKKQILMDSIHIALDSIDTSQTFEFITFGEGLYRTNIFITPGDTLSFKIKNEKLSFTGKNAPYNNFFTNLEKETPEYSKNPYLDNIENYKKSTENVYNQKVKYFEAYIEHNKLKSESLLKIIKDMLKFEYLNNLISPRSVFVEKMNGYVNTQEGVLSTMNNEFVNQEQLFDLDAYLDGTTIEDFNRPDLLKNSWAFKNSFDAFIRYYFANSDYLNYSSKAFLYQKEFIQEHFDGELENYAIARMIREYSIRGFGYSTENIDLMKGLIDKYYPVFSKKPSYKSKMDEFKESLNKFNFKLSKEALSSKLISINGDTITLQEVFDTSKNKIKVIDFWASWCSPCIDEIGKAKAFKNKLLESKDVEWIYLSIDKDRTSWLKKSKELKQFLNVNHQYFLVRGKNSMLGNGLKISGIPRYVIFDKKEQIVLDNAPRPSDSLVFKKIIDKIHLAN